MNWGLFLGLESFLLPLSLDLRIVVAGAIGAEATDSVRRFRAVLFAFLLAICAGKLPATIYAVTGDFAALGHATEGFMVTPLGLAQMAAITAGVLLADLCCPGLAGSNGEPRGRAAARTCGVIGLCLLLGWLGAR